MIAETTFAKVHSSIWRTLTPTSELFVRRINGELYQREFAPLVTATAPERRAFINAIAFNAFCDRVGAAQKSVFPAARPSLVDKETLGAAVNNARDEVCKMENLLPFEIPDPEAHELSDSQAQLVRLESFFYRETIGTHLLLRPEFPGCGIIDRCYGDVLASTCLYEIKAGERPFRSIDIRQLLIYCSLNAEAKTYVINEVALFNPRRGVSFKVGIDDLCFEISGRSSAELLWDLSRVVSSGDISR